MAYWSGIIVNDLFGLLGMILLMSIIVRLMYRYFSKEKQETAIVIKKQCYDKQVYRKHEASFLQKEYVITFQCGDKKRHFTVPKFFYEKYKINQKGDLRYQGSRLIDFKERG